MGSARVGYSTIPACWSATPGSHPSVGQNHVLRPRANWQRGCPTRAIHWVKLFGPVHDGHGRPLVIEREECAARSYDAVREQLRSLLLNKDAEQATRTALKKFRPRSCVVTTLPRRTSARRN